MFHPLRPLGNISWNAAQDLDESLQRADGGTIETNATYRFSPPLNKSGKTTRRDGKSTKWWLILECEREIGRYLRHLFEVATHHTRPLQEPLWGAHVSVVRDEEPPNARLWEQLEGTQVPVEYNSKIELVNDFVVAPVRCEAALDYREALGLPREPRIPLHLTIGNLRGK